MGRLLLGLRLLCPTQLPTPPITPSLPMVLATGQWVWSGDGWTEYSVSMAYWNTVVV